MLIIEPGQWMIALGGILFFGTGAVMSVGHARCCSGAWRAEQS